MQIDEWAANVLANATADLLAGGSVSVFTADGALLASCAFADPPFKAARKGAVTAHEFPAAIAEDDGVPARFVALDAGGTEVLSGSAGHKDDQPAPEMKFRARIIVKDADVLVESFVFSVVTASGADQQTQ